MKLRIVEVNMLSVSEVRKILDEIAEGAGIQEINEKNYGNELNNVFYLMSGSESYFMNFTWYDSGSWRVEVADRIMVESAIFTTGNMTIYPRGFDDFAVNMIKDRLNELITNYNKVRKEMKLKDILNARGKYDV
jgi:hypothetical protein